MQRKNVCTLCQSKPLAVGFLCADCDEAMAWLPPPFNVECANGRVLEVQAAGYYVGVLAQAIGQLKDAENLQTIPLLLQALGKLAQIIPDEAVILPLPTTHARLVARGFYPVGLLADYLSLLTDLPLYTGVERIQDGAHQRELDRSARLTNVQNAFALTALPSASTVILFDDVATTGATLQAVAETLWQADSSLSILATCVAHGSPQFDRRANAAL